MALLTAFALLPTASAPAVQFPQSVVVSADPVDGTPHVLDGTVFAIAEVGGHIVVAGSFTQVRNYNSQIVLDRTNIFSYDKATGRIDEDFAPTVNNEILSVAADPSGTAVFIGGKFTNVDGVAINKVAKLDVPSGTLLTSFKANVVGWVNDLKVVQNQLYIAGKFGKVKGVVRQNLAAVDPKSGKPDPELSITMGNGTSTKPAQILKIDVTPDASKIVLIGHFKSVNDQDRARVAVIDRTTSPDSLSAWSTTMFAPMCRAFSDTWIRDVDLSPDGTWFVIGTTGAWGGGVSPVNRLCDSVSRWNLTSETPNQLPQWINETGGDTILAVAATDAAVYAGGHQRWMNNENTTAGDKLGPNGLGREGIAAMDPTTGRALTWNPGRARGLGVRDLVATSDQLLVGSDTELIGGEYHARIAAFPVEGGAPGEIDHSLDIPGVVHGVTLVEAGTQQCLDVQDGTVGQTATEQPCNGGPSQRFTLTDAWRLQVDASGYCVDAGSGGSGSVLTVQPCNGSMSQYWVRSGSTFVNVVARKCMDSESSHGRLWVQTNSCSGKSDQNWAPTP